MSMWLRAVSASKYILGLPFWQSFLLYYDFGVKLHEKVRNSILNKRMSKEFVVS